MIIDLEYYTSCRQLADDWLGKIDSTNYLHLLSIQTIKNEDIPRVISYIDKVRESFGRVKSREFIGSHIWSSKMLLTYAPRIDDSHLAYIHAGTDNDYSSGLCRYNCVEQFRLEPESHINQPYHHRDFNQGTYHSCKCLT